MQVVSDDNAIELQALQRPATIFQVSQPNRDADHTGQSPKRLRVTVNGANPETQRSQKTTMTTPAASKIQNLAIRYDLVRPASDPLRRLIDAVTLILNRCGNDEIVALGGLYADFTAVRRGIPRDLQRRPTWERFDTSGSEC